MKKWFHFGTFSNRSLVQNLFWWSFVTWLLFLANFILDRIHLSMVPCPAENVFWILRFQQVERYLYLFIIPVMLRLGCEIIYKIIEHTSPQDK